MYFPLKKTWRSKSQRMSIAKVDILDPLCILIVGYFFKYGQAELVKKKCGISKLQKFFRNLYNLFMCFWYNFKHEKNLSTTCTFYFISTPSDYHDKPSISILLFVQYHPNLCTFLQKCAYCTRFVHDITFDE